MEMADIQTRINEIGQFFKEMQVTQVDGTSVIYVVVMFPDRWKVYGNVTEEKYNVSVMEGNEPGEYYFCAEMSTGFDAVFNAVDHCISVNKDAMERSQLFQEKLKELKDIFADGANTIKRLRTLDFVFKPQKKETKRKVEFPAQEPKTDDGSDSVNEGLNLEQEGTYGDGYEG